MYRESESNCIKRNLDDTFCTYVRNMIKTIVVMTKETYRVLENKL